MKSLIIALASLLSTVGHAQAAEIAGSGVSDNSVGAVTTMVMQVYSEYVPVKGRLTGKDLDISGEWKAYFGKSYFTKYAGRLFNDYAVSGDSLTGAAYDEAISYCGKTISNWDVLNIERSDLDSDGSDFTVEPSKYSGSKSRKIGLVRVYFERFLNDGKSKVVVDRSNETVQVVGPEESRLTGHRYTFATYDIDCDNLQ